MDAGNRFEKVRAAIEQLGPADHVCTLYEHPDEEVAIAVSYIRAGLARGELCVCVVDDGGERILEALASEGVDIDREMRNGRLVIFEKPLAQGLQTRDMLEKIEQFASASRNDGHAGFRIGGEMSWSLNGDMKALAEFEAGLNLNRVWERHACTGLCQFERHGERTGARARFTATPTDARAPVEIETACFRIAQEALSNATRHARARHIEVTLTAQDVALEVTVRDDGAGFNVEQNRTGLGLVGMNERAELAGGRLDIESSPGTGTTVRARFPLR